ncbi:MAG: DUF1679 domain-containing protein [Spirochaetales bacterium]|nr:DUF1679 domain-containing protein [Spirochaetales bacterium]
MAREARYSKDQIIDLINRSGKFSQVRDIRFSGTEFSQGILGNLEKIELEYFEPNKQPSHLIYKSQNCSDKLREGVLYKLFSEIKDLSLPQFIGDFENGDILIEYLEHHRTGTIREGCTRELAGRVLEEIGKVHSHYWNHPQIPEDKPEGFAGILKYNLEENLDDYFERYSDSLSDVKADFEWLLSHTKEASQVLYNGQTLTHGDLHLENILFSPSDDITLIDWQLGVKRTPAFDVSFFLIQNLEGAVRREGEKELLDNYYRGLSESVKGEYSFSQFYREYRACLTRSMMTSVMMIGKRFAHKKEQMAEADIMARRVIGAVGDLKPVDAVKELMG